MRDFEEFLVESFEESLEIEKEVTVAGKQRKMIFKPINAELGDAIRKKCKKVSIFNGQKVTESNGDQFIANLIIETVVSPDFKNASFQDAWGVKSAEQLLAAMKQKMKDGEYGELAALVNRINGYDKGMQQLVEEAKN